MEKTKYFVKLPNEDYVEVDNLFEYSLLSSYKPQTSAFKLIGMCIAAVAGFCALFFVIGTVLNAIYR